MNLSIWYTLFILHKCSLMEHRDVQTFNSHVAKYSIVSTILNGHMKTGA